MKRYVAQGNLGHTDYLETDVGLYCQTTYPSGFVSFHEVSDAYPIERIVGQLGAEQVE